MRTILTIIIIISVLALFSACAPNENWEETHMDDMMERKELSEDSRPSLDAYTAFTEPIYEVSSSNINYFGDAVGFYSEPTEAGNYPGVVMIHEWYGLNDNIKAMAEVLASQGYRVLAVDLYNGVVAQNSSQARELTQSVVQEDANANMQAAQQYLINQGAMKTASLGWCFGGAQSLQFSLSEASLDATVIYYGRLTANTTELQSIDEPILGIFGAEDGSIPPSDVNAFQGALNEIGKTNDITIYDGVGHAFANPTGNNYAQEETTDAWMKTLEFLNSNLKE